MIYFVFGIFALIALALCAVGVRVAYKEIRKTAVENSDEGIANVVSRPVTDKNSRRTVVRVAWIILATLAVVAVISILWSGSDAGLNSGWQ